MFAKYRPLPLLFFEDLKEDSLEIIFGFSKVHYHIDENHKLHSVYCYDKDGQVVEEPGEASTISYVVIRF